MKPLRFRGWSLTLRRGLYRTPRYGLLQTVTPAQAARYKPPSDRELAPFLAERDADLAALATVTRPTRGLSQLPPPSAPLARRLEVAEEWVRALVGSPLAASAAGDVIAAAAEAVAELDIARSILAKVMDGGYVDAKRGVIDVLVRLTEDEVKLLDSHPPGG